MTALIIALLETPEQSVLIRNCLKAAGHEVILVENFSKAKSILKVSICDLILSDVHLQNGGNVFDFLKWVRSKPRLQEIPFVLLSVEPSPTAKYLGESVRYASRVLGAAKYVSMHKFDCELLMSELSEFLPKHST
jgi:CheY-like chemotaxis protein